MWRVDRVARAGGADTIEVVAVSLDLAPEAVAPLTAFLCGAELRRASRFRFARERRRFIVARGRLRQLLAERLGVPPQSIEFRYGENGKPTLHERWAHTGWCFNVAHCSELALYAFARGCEIGIDIEVLRAVPEADGIVGRFFSPRENQAYRALAAHDKTLGFFNGWTRKEAFVKALGDGLSLPLDRFDVTLAPGEPAAVLGIEGVPGDGGWRMESFSPLPGFIAAVATHSA